MLNEYNEKNYYQEMKDRLTITFEDKPVFDKYLKLFSSSFDSSQLAIKQLMQQRSIDSAVGKQLDIIGDIVGQPRDIVDSEFVKWFGYFNNPGASEYGDLSNSAKGGRYWDGEADLLSSVSLDDEQYRVFIKAKIIKNTTRATAEDVIEYLKFVFNAQYVQISDFTPGEAFVDITTAGNFTNFEKALLTMFSTDKFDKWFFPKPLGVSMQFTVILGLPFTYAGGSGTGRGYSGISGSYIGGIYKSFNN